MLGQKKKKNQRSSELLLDCIFSRKDINAATDCWCGHVCFEKFLRMELKRAELSFVA